MFYSLLDFLYRKHLKFNIATNLNRNCIKYWRRSRFNFSLFFTNK